MQFKFKQYVFEASWLATSLMLLCVVTFVKLGLWQYGKAMHKQAIESTYQASKVREAVDLIDYIEQPAQLEFQQVRVEGRYETQYQILVDNQVEDRQVGYHVVTPFHIKNTDHYVLVNRGWVKGFDEHARLPEIKTPTDTQEIQGMVWLPTTKIFTLEKKDAEAESRFETVWQHLDMQKYQKIAPLKVLSVIVKLAPEQKEGGFVRNWQMPPSRIATNLSYAYQWFGFALAAVGIYIYLGFKQEKKTSHAN
jgi:surfeit locus 1 family protein